VSQSNGVGRAQTTRIALLTAAREVFTEAGYADANISDIVDRAASSVGSLYHHFGGKQDLYIALYDDYQHRQQRLPRARTTRCSCSSPRAHTSKAAGKNASSLGCSCPAVDHRASSC
jgi:AcrR family transcriptional regulator